MVTCPIHVCRSYLEMIIESWLIDKKPVAGTSTCFQKNYEPWEAQFYRTMKFKVFG